MKVWDWDVQIYKMFILDWLLPDHKMYFCFDSLISTGNFWEKIMKCTLLRIPPSVCILNEDHTTAVQIK